MPIKRKPPGRGMVSQGGLTLVKKRIERPWHQSRAGYIEPGKQLLRHSYPLSLFLPFVIS